MHIKEEKMAKTLIEILTKNYEQYPEKTALICGDQLISYKSVYEQSMLLASFLRGLGIEKGDRVGLLLNKTSALVISFLGIAAAGGIVVPMDAGQPDERLQGLINFVTPSAMILDVDFQTKFSRLGSSCPNDKVIIVGEDNLSPYRKWHEIFSNNSDVSPDMNINENDPVYFNLTSGTTGMPKCAVTTHSNIYWNTLASIQSLELTQEDVHLCMFPAFLHPHEIFARSFYLSGTAVLNDKISPKSLSKVITENKVTCVMATSSIYETLLRYHNATDIEFTSLRFCESGGMHTSSDFVKEFKERFNIPIIPVWGSTETTGIAFAANQNGRSKPNSMGKVCPFYEAKVVDKEGNELPPGIVGEMAVKGPGVISYYFNNTLETDRHMKDGWYFTGDIVKKDDEGYYFFVDRKARMMKVAGLKVFPAEIECVLYSHPDVSEAVVVKVHDESHGEAPKAIIVLKNGTSLSKKDIRNYCKERMAGCKVPRYFEFRESLPRTPGGKILLSEL